MSGCNAGESAIPITGAKRDRSANALQDLAPTEVSQNQPITINEIDLLADDFGLCEPSKHSEASRAGALQDLAYVQVPLLAGVVSLAHR